MGRSVCQTRLVMRKGKYPLESLLGVREAQVDDATSSLGNAVRAREEAERERARAEAARVEHERLAEEKRTSERQALQEGQLTVADLARNDAWEFGVHAQASQLAQQAAVATKKVDDARTGEDRARDALAAKKADADVVDKDKARFVERQNKRALAVEEELAEEAWRPKRA
jgi:YscO-like protein